MIRIIEAIAGVIADGKLLEAVTVRHEGPQIGSDSSNGGYRDVVLGTNVDEKVLLIMEIDPESELVPLRERAEEMIVLLRTSREETETATRELSETRTALQSAQTARKASYEEEGKLRTRLVEAGETNEKLMADLQSIRDSLGSKQIDEILGAN